MDVFLGILEDEVEGSIAGSGMKLVLLEDESVWLVKLFMPSEFLVTFSVDKDDCVLGNMLDAVRKIVRFKDLYMDGALDAGIGNAFLELPGVFTFITEKVDIRITRLLRIILDDAYGRHNIYSVNVSEESVRVSTRGGRFYFKYTDFNVSVKKEMELMDMVMRKPLRNSLNSEHKK